MGRETKAWDRDSCLGEERGWGTFGFYVTTCYFEGLHSQLWAKDSSATYVMPFSSVSLSTFLVN